MIKLIAIDIDGTLLNSHGEVSEQNKIAIKSAIEQGTEVVLTSGRISSSVKNLAFEIGADKYIIAGNGAIVYDIKQGNVVYNNYIPREKVLEIIKTCEENSIFYNIYTTDAIITKFLNYNLLYYHYENKKNIPEKRTNINITEDVYKYIEEYPKNDFLKIHISDSDKIIFDRMMNKLKQINKINMLEASYMSRKTIKQGTEEIEINYLYTEITNENTNKWSAIKYLMNKSGIQKDEVLAIGDNFNDKEMLENAGIGIAMGNSNPTIKEISDYIVSDNNSDGVAEAINKYI